MIIVVLAIGAGCDRSETGPRQGSYRTTEVVETTTCKDPNYPAEYRPDYGFEWTQAGETTYGIWFNDDSDAGIDFPCTLNGATFECEPESWNAGVNCGDVYTTYAVGGAWLSDEDVRGTFLFSKSGTLFEEVVSDPCVDLCSWTFEFVANYEP